MIAIVDYRAGNIASVERAIQHLGFASCVTSDPDVVYGADRIILPGVGHFASANYLHTSGIAEAIREAAASGTPLLGICLGMQWLFEGSDEAPAVSALKIFSGFCSRFPGHLKSPHVGWNDLLIFNRSRLCSGLSPNEYVYYTHSYRAALTDDTVAVSEYGGVFSAIVERDNVFGVQFHPEKSASWGLQLLANFCELQC